MAFWDRLFSRASLPQPRVSTQSGGAGTLITTPEELEAALRGGAESASGERVTAETSMRVGAVYACVRLISGPTGTVPLQLKRWVDERTRESARDHPLWKVLERRPNRWQTPAQFKRMMTAHVLLRGAAYARIVKTFSGEVQELIPLNPDRVKVEQNDDLTLSFVYSHPNGRILRFKQTEILYLYSLTLDGVNGVTPITYARETIGAALAMEKHGSRTFKNGAQVSGYLSTDKELGKEGRENLRAGLEEYKASGDRAGSWMILEDGLKAGQLGMTAEDAQWIEGRKFSRSDIAMFFGVPPHMIGDTDKTTSWGSGIEQQTQGFVTYTLEDYFTMWEEAVERWCVKESQTDIYVRFNRKALVRGDIKTRWEAYVKAMQWGVYSPNRVLELEDENPRAGGDIYYDPPNTAGGAAGNEERTTDEPEKPA